MSASTPTISTASNTKPLAELAGWGGNLRAPCALIEPESPAQLAAHLDHAGTIARGLGRSYGDPALNAGGQVIGTTRMDRYIAFDAQTGTLVCEAGVSLAQIIEDFAPRGWFPMITPGTRFVTIGGCIANDIHGKAHHVQGCFSNSVDEITVLLASGEVVRASREENPELFWATFGGMGLLGIVLTAQLRLRKIETTYFRQKSKRVNDLEEMVAALDEADHSYPYSVATVDAMARGARVGRGVVNFGDHARLEELPARFASAPLKVAGPPKLTVPIDLPELTLNALSIRIVNAVILNIQSNLPEYSDYAGFFYPLDRIAHWNRGYGRRGFAQYQFVIPFAEGVPRLRAILGAMQAHGELPFLNVLKRFGKEGNGHLSFPREGYTFAIDFPIRANTVSLLRKLDAMVLEAGGRIYLGKDSCVEAPMFRAMYPRLDEWLAIKHKVDPKGVFTSDLARRVGLVP